MYKNFKNKKILLVEDDEHTRLMMTKHISIFNHQKIDAVDNCKKGYELFTQNSYDLIITDYQTPLMTCDDFIPMIRKSDKNIPIFIVSADNYDSHIDFVNKYEINGYFEKPCRIVDLVKYINDYFKSLCIA